MKGTNFPLGPVAGDGSALMVRETFLSIQGEGPLAGKVAFFVRLAGCPLRCSWCDTDFSLNRSSERGASEIAEEAAAALAHVRERLVVLTGGEPLRFNVSELVRQMNLRRISVQVETSGVLFPEGGLEAFKPDPVRAGRGVVNTIVVAPKTSKVHKEVRKLATAWKYVIERGSVSKSDGLPKSSIQKGHKGKGNRPARPPKKAIAEGRVWLIPCDYGSGIEIQNRSNAEAAMASVLKFGYRFGAQLHKLAGAR